MDCVRATGSVILWIGKSMWMCFVEKAKIFFAAAAAPHPAGHASVGHTRPRPQIWDPIQNAAPVRARAVVPTPGQNKC